MNSQTLPPPQGPEYMPCGCGHIEPEHRPDTGSCLVCGCAAYLTVPAAVEPPADRAAVLREAATIAESLRQFEPATGARKSAQVSENVGILRVAAELRRMADETATTGPQSQRDETLPVGATPMTVYLATPCDACDHTLNWHRNDVGCTVALCVCGRFQEPAAGARQDGAQPESCAHCGQPISLVTGTLAAWWVHNPGGNTVCDWARAAASTRATPAAGARQDGTVATETQPEEDPARIDRLRPEFFEHASVESIDVQIRRAQRQQRHWGNRERTLAILRQARVLQKEHGEQPAAAARQDEAQR